VGGLIALFERAVGLYASLVGINAYHQPGVEAGKKAATAILTVRESVINFLRQNTGTGYTTKEIASEINNLNKTDWVFKILENLAINQPEHFRREKDESPTEYRFSAI